MGQWLSPGQVSNLVRIWTMVCHLGMPAICIFQNATCCFSWTLVFWIIVMLSVFFWSCATPEVCNLLAGHKWHNRYHDFMSYTQGLVQVTRSRRFFPSHQSFDYSKSSSEAICVPGLGNLPDSVCRVLECCLPKCITVYDKFHFVFVWSGLCLSIIFFLQKKKKNHIRAILTSLAVQLLHLIFHCSIYDSGMIWVRQTAVILIKSITSSGWLDME